MSQHTIEDFKPGQRVLYVPYHAHDDISHEDCERGTVVRIGVCGVFVKFKGDTPQGCNPDQLVITGEPTL